MCPKWCPAALLAGKLTGGNSGGDTRHHGSETAVQHLLSITLADAAAALQDGAVSFPDGTIRGFEASLTQSSPTVNGQNLTPPREPIQLSTNTRIVQSCSPCRGKVSRNALLFQPPILPLSLLFHSEPSF